MGTIEENKLLSQGDIFGKGYFVFYHNSDKNSALYFLESAFEQAYTGVCRVSVLFF
jgi:hypothetical protein